MRDIKLEAKYNKDKQTSIDAFKEKYRIEGTQFQFISPGLTFLDRYKYVLLSTAETREMNKRYYMRPNYVAFDEYEDMSLWPIILYVNDCFTIEDFIIPNFLVPKRKAIADMLRENIIYNTNNEEHVIKYEVL